MHISGFAFGPSSVTIALGDSVEWDNHDAFSHSATADDGSWGSPVLGAGESWTFTPSGSGTFAYHCAVHPSMTGTLVVTGGGGNVAPTVAIGSPASGATVSGSIVVSGTATDAEGALERVEVAVDGGAFAPASGAASWTFLLSTASLANGAHEIRARSFDGSLFSAVASVSIVVDNPASAEPPVVTVSSPLAGATLRGTVTISGGASDPDGAVSRVEVAVDGGAFALASGTSSWSFELDTRALANGDHVVRARAFDGALFGEIVEVPVVVRNLADLRVREGDLTVGAGYTSKTVTARVSNDGTAAAGASVVAFHYRYADEWHLIGTANVASIAEGGSRTATVTWSTLGFVGEFEVRATVDATGAVPELVESNNERATSAICVIDGPPLVVPGFGRA